MTDQWKARSTLMAGRSRSPELCTSQQLLSVGDDTYDSHPIHINPLFPSHVEKIGR